MKSHKLCHNFGELGASLWQCWENPKILSLRIVENRILHRKKTLPFWGWYCQKNHQVFYRNPGFNHLEIKCICSYVSIYFHIFSYGPTKCDHDGISCFQGMLTQQKSLHGSPPSLPVAAALQSFRSFSNFGWSSPGSCGKVRKSGEKAWCGPPFSGMLNQCTVPGVPNSWTPRCIRCVPPVWPPSIWWENVGEMNPNPPK